ncbi:hypothetical protein [Cellulosilyticum lentocellum]|uniref:Uncharacterized protein n=1 Tax=Cellulosilyticum lentocellum (strain ATCC 49066 / DSM 5427 / NCIMB 11756 / RHM5) TaxID=642492 RepID=F2JHV0_CELLD|nr:hypothetical protein [Cellulosilyticum lentocellum]ADZ85442.1 hypothetical protein Clole_3762 [Cellulosilyticum lentocellum DSM 5427]
MRGIAKATLISIIVAVALFVFTSFIYFFPWYTTLIVETFNLSQIVAGDNYLKDSYYHDTLSRLQDKPIFKEYSDEIRITIRREDGKEYNYYDDDETLFETSMDQDKPYQQRGHTIEVTIRAVYPLRVKIWGKTITKELDRHFTMKTVGLKHYKDLDYYTIK